MNYSTTGQMLLLWGFKNVLKNGFDMSDCSPGGQNLLIIWLLFTGDIKTTMHSEMESFKCMDSDKKLLNCSAI